MLTLMSNRFLEGAQVQVDEQLGDGAVEFGESEELPVAQARQYPSLHEEHRALDLGLVARVRRARGQHRTAVVLGEFLIGAVGLGVVAVGGLDQRAGLVGHDQAR